MTGIRPMDRGSLWLSSYWGFVAMTYEQIIDRFSALLQQVETAHGKCKEDQTVPSLFEMFYHVHFLGVAFMQDCQQLAESTNNALPPEDLMEIITQISSALQCSIRHINTSAEKLNTHTMLNKIIHKVMSGQAGYVN